MNKHCEKINKLEKQCLELEKENVSFKSNLSDNNIIHKNSVDNLTKEYDIKLNSMKTENDCNIKDIMESKKMDINNLIEKHDKEVF